MAQRHYYHTPTLIRDIATIIIINVIAFVIFGYTDALEWFHDFSRRHEHIEIDEIIPLGFTLTVSLLVFSYRRIRELNQIASAFEQLSLRDPLTQVLNRRAGQIALAKWDMSQLPFVALQIDLDDFKSINNLYGISVGDEILIKVADLLTDLCPNEGRVYRWLDDNFIILAPLTSESPFDLGNKIAQAFDNNFSSNIAPITCAIGVTVAHKDESITNMLERLEDALLHAKAQGANKVKAA